MSIDIFKKTGLFVVLVLAQALVCNHIHLFGYATPLIYVYFVLLFRREYPHWAVLVWSFLLGLVIDIYSNTPGVGAASMTFLGMVQPYLLIPFLPRDTEGDFQPSIRTLGLNKFLWYTILLVFLYCLIFFSLEAFSFFNWQEWLLTMLASTLLTVLLIIVIANLKI